MARTVRNHQLAKRSERARLKARHEPYWQAMNEGQHLGYYRGARVGKWVARYRQPGASGGYAKQTLGEADDTADANGSTILDWRQAQDAARTWFAEIDKDSGRVAGPYTVSEALDEYIDGFTGKSVAKTRARIEVIIRPDLGFIEVRNLTADRISKWHHGRAKSPAKLRTARFAKAINTRSADDDDAIRRRRSTANRDLTVLKAALNKAYRSGRVATDDAWRRVLPFPNVEAAKLRYLSDDEARRLVNACDLVFRPMVQASLLTGARYGELSAVRVSDVDLAAGTMWLTDTKAGRPRVVYLEAEGQELIQQQAHGKAASDLLFPRPDGKRWGPSQQARYLARACARANVEPTATFHDLRRTFGARLARLGVPMAVIAEALGHADERITRRHYAHLAPSHVAETVRTYAAGMGIVTKDNVRRLEAKR